MRTLLTSSTRQASPFVCTARIRDSSCTVIAQSVDSSTGRDPEPINLSSYHSHRGYQTSHALCQWAQVDYQTGSTGNKVVSGESCVARGTKLGGEKLSQRHEIRMADTTPSSDHRLAHSEVQQHLQHTTSTANIKTVPVQRHR